MALTVGAWSPFVYAQIAKLLSPLWFSSRMVSPSGFHPTVGDLVTVR